jgi:hypothetical protein
MATNQDYSGEWTKDKWCKGPGYIIEGNVTHKRVHTVKLAQKGQSANALPTKFLAFRVELTSDPIKRTFGPDGQELVPNLGATVGKTKGFLHHIDKTKVKGDLTNVAELNAAVDASSKALQQASRTALHPNTSNVFEFWVDWSTVLNLDVNVGKAVRLKTLGNSIFVEAIAVLTGNSQNVTYSGQDVGGVWTNKIVAQDVETSSAQPAAFNNPSNDDEW